MEFAIDEIDDKEGQQSIAERLIAELLKDDRLQQLHEKKPTATAATAATAARRQ